MPKMPFFSIVVPVYNKELHVVRAIQSVLNQSFQNFELIIVCDPSTDNSNFEVLRFTDHRIQVFYRNEPGPGGYAARNLGIKKARGEWIAFLDADDEWLPHHLKRLQALSCEFPDIYMIGCGWKSQFVNITKTDKYYKNHELIGDHIINVESYLKKGLHGERPIHTSVACLKRSSPVINDLFIIHPEVKRGGDLYAWLKMICYHREMAWSAHVGAVYYTDAINMVTKTASSTGYLMRPESLNLLSNTLTKTEKRRLQKYFNRWLRNDWKSNIHRGCANFKLGEKLFWRGNFIYALVIYLTTVWPQNLRKFFGGSGRKF